MSRPDFVLLAKSVKMGPVRSDKYPLSFLLIAALSLLLIFWLGQLISRPAIILWDEGGYLFSGFKIYQTLRQADWPAFWQETRSQFYYPFLHAWFLGGLGLIFGFDPIRLRLVGLFLLVFSSLLIFKIGNALSQKSGLLASLVFLTSPAMLFFHSIAMRERLGLFLTLLSLYLFFLAKDRRQTWLFGLTGLSLTSLFLHKYNYGLLVAFALAAEGLFSGLVNKEIFQKRFWQANLSLFLPLAVVAGWWIFYPENKWPWFASILSNEWFRTYHLAVLNKLFYYPLELVFSYSFSPTLTLLLTVGFVYSLKFWRSFKVRTLALLFLINFSLAVRHSINLVARFIFTTTPVFFILGSFGLVKLGPLLARRLKKPGFWLGLSLPLLIVGSRFLAKDLINLPKMIRPIASHLNGSPLFYQTDYYPEVPFDFSPRRWPRQYQKGEGIGEVLDFIFKNVDYRQPVTLVGQLNELSPDLFRLYLELVRLQGGRTKVGGDHQYWVALEVRPNSIFNTLDYQQGNKLLKPQVLATKNNPGLTKMASREFANLGLVITILAK